MLPRRLQQVYGSQRVHLEIQQGNLPRFIMLSLRRSVNYVEYRRSNQEEQAVCPLQKFPQLDPFLPAPTQPDLSLKVGRAISGARPQYKEGILKVSISCSAIDRGVRERSAAPRRTRQRHRQAQVTRQLQRLLHLESSNPKMFPAPPIPR